MARDHSQFASSGVPVQAEPPHWVGDGDVHQSVGDSVLGDRDVCRCVPYLCILHRVLHVPGKGMCDAPRLCVPRHACVRFRLTELFAATRQEGGTGEGIFVQPALAFGPCSYHNIKVSKFIVTSQSFTATIHLYGNSLHAPVHSAPVLPLCRTTLPLCSHWPPVWPLYG